MSLASKILSAKRPFKDVRVPEWDLTCRVQTLSGRERMEWWDAVLLREKACVEAEEKGEKLHRYDDTIMQLIFAVKDPKTNKRVLTVEQHDELLEVSYTALEALGTALVELNMQSAAVEDMETLKKSS